LKKPSQIKILTYLLIISQRLFLKDSKIMTLKEKINEDIKQAMKAKNTAALTALRELKSIILLEETKEGRSGDLSEVEDIAVITKAIKQRKESYEMFASQDRTEQANEQKSVIDIMEKYLPQQLSLEEVQAKVKAIVDSIGATSVKDMGKVMGLASKELAGQVDNKILSETVKSFFN
jgi:uncharacterized protein